MFNKQGNFQKSTLPEHTNKAVENNETKPLFSAPKGIKKVICFKQATQKLYDKIVFRHTILETKFCFTFVYCVIAVSTTLL